MGLELSILGYNVFRVYDEEFIPTFDLDKEVPTATNQKMIENFLRKKSISQKSSFIERNYFYKYDKMGSDRFEKLLRNFNSKVKNWMFSCRNCLSKKLIKVVNIGSQPLSGVFYKKKPLI